MPSFTSLLVTPANPTTLDTPGMTSYSVIDVLGGDLTITGSGVDVVASDLLANRGIINVDNHATFDITGGADNNATFFTIGSGGTLIEGGSEYNHLSPVDFTGGGGKLELNTAGGFQPRPLSPILGFQAGDTIEVTSPITSVMYNEASGKLTLLDGNMAVGSLTVVGNGLAAGFNVTPDGPSGYDITVACFLPQTLVLTERGEVPAGEIAIGDRVITGLGEAEPVKWVGRRSYSASMVASAPHVAPILVREGALADGLPKRDLYLSPCHALYLDGVLIEAGHLVNGVSIVRCEPADVDYVNFEFEAHEIITVEGVAAETGAGHGKREIYDNAAEYASLYPDDATGTMKPYCAPRHDCGFVVEAVRRRIDARAGIVPVVDSCTAPLVGWITSVDANGINGVAYCRGGADPVLLEVLVDGHVVGEVVANHHRSIRTATEQFEGRCGFNVKLPEGVSPYLRHVLNVRRASDKTELQGSPYMMEAAVPMTELGRRKLEAALGEAVSQAGSVAEVDHALAFLAAKAEQLLQAKSDLAGRRGEVVALRPVPGQTDLRPVQETARAA